MAVPVLRLYDGFADTSPQLRDEVRELQARLRQTDRGIVVAANAGVAPSSITYSGRRIVSASWLTAINKDGTYTGASRRS